MKSYINILATADTSTIVTKTMAGKEYTVVPCIALVEGVLQGANSPEPELALASEFGKMVDGWNGRPLVLNHPKVNGSFVSANSPEVLEGWQMGYIFNARVEDKKLKVDAWIDNARVEELGGEFTEIKEAIVSGDMIEVSTGLYTELVKMHGVYQGEKYGAVWENIVPDHLAILSVGTIGACSVEDGCGIPRLNSQQQLAIGKSHPEMRIHMSGIKQSNNKDVKTETSCSCGGKAPEANTETTTTETTDEPNTNARAVDPKTHDALAAFEAQYEKVSAINVNAYPSNMPDSNVRKLLFAALQNSELVQKEQGLWSLHMFTAEEVIFETWSVVKQRSWKYNISSDFKVEFIGEPQEVVILSQVVPVTNSDAKPGDAGVKGNATVTAKETQMTDVKETKDTGVQANQATDPTGNQSGAAPGVSGSEAATQITVETEEAKGKGNPKVLSTEDYIAQAPDEIKAVLNSALEQRNQNRAALISAITANKANVFAEAELKAMNDDMLKKLANLAGKTVDYSGNVPIDINTRVQAETDAPPEAPKVFAKKSA